MVINDQGRITAATEFAVDNRAALCWELGGLRAQLSQSFAQQIGHLLDTAPVSGDTGNGDELGKLCQSCFDEVTAGTFRQLIVDLYRNNRLMEGNLMIRGERVDLNRLRANLLTVIAEADHITPPCQTETVMAKVGSTDKTVMRIPGGHIGIMAGSGASKRTWPQIDAWLSARSE